MFIRTQSQISPLLVLAKLEDSVGEKRLNGCSKTFDFLLAHLLGANQLHYFYIFASRMHSGGIGS